jgi:hypothetical protein
VQFDLGDMSAADKAEIDKASPFVRSLVERAREAQKDPQATATRIRHALIEWAPRIAACLVPLLAFLTWLFFRRPKLFFVEHLVFALHAHATAFLLLLVGEVLRFDIVAFAGFVAATVLVFIAMRRVFAQSWLRTAWKFVLIGFAYSIFLGIGAAGAAALGFFSKS